MNEEQEKALSEFSVENAYYLHGLIKLLLKKGIITEQEIDEEYAVAKMNFENDDSDKIN